MNVPQLIVSMAFMTNVNIAHTFLISWNVLTSVFITIFRQTTVHHQTMEIIQQCKFNNFFFFETKVSMPYPFKCFNCLPVAAIIASKIYCCQGGNIWFFLHSISTYFFIVWRSFTWSSQLRTNSTNPATDRCAWHWWGEMSLIILMLLNLMRLNNKADK